MQIVSLALDPTARLHALPGLGVALALAADRARPKRYVVDVVCRVAKSALTEGPLELPASVFLIAVHAINQVPRIVNLVGGRVLFVDDVRDEGVHCAAVLRAELDTTDGPIGPFLLHASCLEFVSNVVYVP